LLKLSLFRQAQQPCFDKLNSLLSENLIPIRFQTVMKYRSLTLPAPSMERERHVILKAV